MRSNCTNETSNHSFTTNQSVMHQNNTSQKKGLTFPRKAPSVEASIMLRSNLSCSDSPVSSVVSKSVFSTENLGSWINLASLRCQVNGLSTNMLSGVSFKYKYNNPKRDRKVGTLGNMRYIAFIACSTHSSICWVIILY